MLPASVLNRLRRRAPTLLLGAVEGAKAFLLAEAQRLLGAPVVAVVPDNDALHRLSENLRAYAPREILLKFPALTGNPFKGEAPHARLLHERAAALGALASGEDFSFLVAAAPAAAMRLAPFAVFDEAAMALRPDGAMSLEEFLRQLEAAGYLHADRVVEPGEFSHRGGVVDVFPPFAPQPSAGEPLRVEFFGDRIESLRRFDPATQRSAGPVERALVTCESEIVLSDAAARRWRDAALARGASQDAAERTARGLERRDRFPGIEFHAAWLYENTSSLEALLRGRFEPDEMLLAADEPPLCRSGVRRARASYAAMAAASGETAAPGAEEIFLEELPLLDSPHVSLHELPQPPAPLPQGEEREEGRVVSLQTAKPPRFDGNLEMLAEYLQEILQPTGPERQEGRRVVLGVSSLGRGRRLADSLAQVKTPRAGGLDVEYRPEISLETFHETAPTIGKLPVLDGFEWPENNLFILAESDMFEEARLLAPSKPAHAAAASVAEVFSEGLRGLAEGDYVVHADHGVGKFAALRTLRTDGYDVECLEVQYEDGKIYVPLERLGVVEKFASKDAFPPPSLARLGSASWKRLRTRMERSMASLAGELLALSAKRASRPGHAFPPDTSAQRDFEETFPFELTPGQARAVEEVKRDLESPHPMDRLLVGDVGFGKTEVAARAAFKVVSAGKQAALLAPTTVLSEQHMLTFRERFRGLPVRIAHLSRLQDAGEQKKIAAELSEGKVDIVIGTHRLLSKDVRFAGLGLVVLDEEQRFGVAQKEKIKQWRETVDVLSMSATPVPRTLQMALGGIRDMSLIETPPPNRLAVHTIVLPFDEDVVRSAVERELRRGGQVYYVHNDTATLSYHAKLVERLVPRARTVSLHGQMPPRRIERTLIDFLARRYDVLAATSIVENGVDIASVNTLVVTNAHAFGLADLYQLRGRVGRSDVRAYAYLFVPTDAALTDEARERLRALQEFSFLGAGFQLAARDLEIRGAGNLLGHEQSGHIEAVGFGMYLKLLEQKIKELKGEAVEHEAEPTLRFAEPARVPESYVPEMAERFRLYRRLVEARGAESAQRILDETEDLYGPAPEEARRLFEAAGLRMLARRLQMEKIEERRRSLFFTFHAAARVDGRRLAAFLKANQAASRTPSGQIRVDIPSEEYSPMDVARKVLEALL